MNFTGLKLLVSYAPVSRISQPLWLTNATTRMRWFTASGEEQMVYIVVAYTREQWLVGIINYMRVIGTINVTFQRPDALHTRTVHFLRAE